MKRRTEKWTNLHILAENEKTLDVQGNRMNQSRGTMTEEFARAFSLYSETERSELDAVQKSDAKMFPACAAVEPRLRISWNAAFESTLVFKMT